MSAFVCTSEHIAELAKAIVALTGTNLPPREVARVLATENVASVCYRYADDKPFDYAAAVADAMGLAEKPRVVTKPVWLYKMALCLDYQSCEHPGWEASDAKRLLDSLVAVLAHKLAFTELPYVGADYRQPRGYDAAPWEYTGQDQKRSASK